MAPTSLEPPPVPQHVADTVATIARLHARSERDVPRQQRSVEAFTDHLGRPLAVWAIAAIGVAWMALNIALPLAGLHSPDPPPFSWMQVTCSLGALLVAATVLTAQNRQRRVADEHAQLDLQINLLAEQKVAKIISLLEELRRDMPNVANRVDSLAEAMTHAVDPHAVASALRETHEDQEAKPDARSSVP
jgi:uncharacterized membrane protein